MAATIVFSHPTDGHTIDLAGSGSADSISFMGSAGFGYSVAVNSYQDNCYISNSDGSTEAYSGSGSLPNLKWQTGTTAYVANESSGTNLTDVATDEATFKILIDDFGSAVQIQNAEIRVSDCTSITNNPSGIVAQTFEVGASGTSGSAWTNTAGSTVLALNDRTVAASSHSYYIGISVKPISLGAKEFQIYWAGEAIAALISISYIFLM